MIKAIYFKDDSIDAINCVMREGTIPLILTSVSGMTSARRMVDKMSTDMHNWALFTNDPLIVDDAKDVAELSYDDILIYDMKKKEFVQTQTTTRKDLRKTHRFSKLWLGGSFLNTYNLNA